MINKQLMELI